MSYVKDQHSLKNSNKNGDNVLTWVLISITFPQVINTPVSLTPSISLFSAPCLNPEQLF